MALDHMVEATSNSRGLEVHRIKFGEENDATWYNAMTLLERKVTVQVMANCSC
jgi:hypothetical protein